MPVGRHLLKNEGQSSDSCWPCGLLIICATGPSLHIRSPKIFHKNSQVTPAQLNLQNVSYCYAYPVFHYSGKQIW